MDTYIGEFTATIRKRQAELNLKQSDIIQRTGGRLGQSTVAALFRGPDVLRTREKIELLAKALEMDPDDLVYKAATDVVSRHLEKLHLTIPKFCGKEVKSFYKLPLYEIEDLPGVLNKKGYPEEKAKDYIEMPFNYGRYAYGIYIRTDFLSPRAILGDIAVISQEIRPNLQSRQEFQILRTTDGKIKFGVGMELPGHLPIIIFDETPHMANPPLKKSLIDFLHPIVAVFKLPETKRSTEGSRTRRQSKKTDL